MLIVLFYMTFLASENQKFADVSWNTRFSRTASLSRECRIFTVGCLSGSLKHCNFYGRMHPRRRRNRVGGLIEIELQARIACEEMPPIRRPLSSYRAALPAPLPAAVCLWCPSDLCMGCAGVLHGVCLCAPVLGQFQRASTKGPISRRCFQSPCSQARKLGL